MARLFWAALGAAAGVYAVRKVTKAAEAYTPTGVAHGLSDFADGLRELADAIGDFGADVRHAMAERENELRAGTGLDAPLPAGGVAQALHRGAHSADN